MFFNETHMFIIKARGITPIHGYKTNLEFSVFRLSLIANSIQGMASTNIQKQKIITTRDERIDAKNFALSESRLTTRLIFTCFSNKEIYGSDKKSIEHNNSPTSSSEKDKGDFKTYL